MKHPRILVLAILLGLTGATASIAGENAPGCDLKGDEAAQAARVQPYTEEELKVIRWVADRLAAGDPPRFTVPALVQGAGVTEDVIEGLDKLRLQQGLIAEMTRRGLDVSVLGGNCARFSACSIDRDLSGASGEELARYEKEKAEDGAAIDPWRAPDFSLRTTTGSEVTLAALRGRDVALVFLSGHCNHSMETLPLLADLAAEYEGRGLEVLPVYINSGSAEDIRTWSASLGVGIPILVAEEKDLSEAYRFRMVPTTFLIDDRGMIVAKLVGQKDRATLAGAFDALLAPAPASTSGF